LLDQSKTDTWPEIARTLGKIGVEAGAAVPLLLAELKKPDGHQNVAASALGEIGKSAREAIPILEVYAHGKDRRLAFYSINALARITERPEVYIQALIREADSPIRKNQMHVSTIEALETFAILGPEAKSALHFVTNRLRDPDSWERESAIKALAAMGPVARVAIPKLQGIANDQKCDEKLRLKAVEAIARIQGNSKDKEARIAQIRDETLRAEEAKWTQINTKLHSRYGRYMRNLPIADRLEISTFPPPGTHRIPQSTEEPISQLILKGAEAEKIATAWRGLDFGAQFQGLCHEPAYRLRFFNGRKLLMDTTVCWACSNFEIKERFFGFKAEAQSGQDLLRKLDSILPYQRGNTPTQP
jgi:hypothetical protein